MKSYPIRIASLACSVALAAAAQGPPGGGQQAAKVSVSVVEEGIIAPNIEWEGNVFYKEVSQLATEVDGKVTEVLFEEGQHIDKGAVMVRLDFVLLEAEHRAAKALVLQAETQAKLERARLDRAQSLLKDEVTTPQEYDDIRFTAEAADHRVEVAKAEVERLEREIEKKTIRAPFSGRVVDRTSEIGDWKNTGDTVAVFARDDLYDVIVNVTEASVVHAKVGMTIAIRVAGKTFPGEIVTVIPRGDTKNRTFPVKIRVEKQEWLVEGMTAWATLPDGEARNCVIVPRDAILQDGSQRYVYRVDKGLPVRTVVTIVGRDGLRTGIEANGIKSGDEVIVRGQERIRPGQPIDIERAG
ncbi:MAG: efflux RND transporter periplasmic adaptor subunit [Candidatus Hydrogenedentes bacterium]|nr:efflux RND transporter periplasmic adaptor subunit [Candidatus Hydrogenedentota bacterium]